ncbi:ParB/RepB/Spo0J family partition protein [[Clostridium] polysaccharolyticum]|uniref:Chromosome partitioning protein, ParB family n=1 Tax=[Clostridium] polysaccharolyticum TaxID=29364 RepID=A0A1I0F2H7_9FIRM|nr:ParB/RepB/Spo0J family partition protein [[Clostridium] polysaccharolyticum]SET52230.1 chromosome partitioning protein, ParB family [[Clostridium] polysaccharolyticum]
MSVKGKHGLGKGLDSMIPAKREKVVSDIIKMDDVSRETLININEIEPNREQPRRRFDEDSLIELSESIKQYGIVQPLILQKKNEMFEIVAGERRWRAARLAGLKKVPAIIKNYTEREVIEIALIENIQREDLNPIEEAYAYKKLIEEFELKQDEVAERVSKSRVAITNSLRLLKLGENVQQMLIDELISSGHARALLGVADVKKQNELAMQVLDQKLSVRDTEKLVKNVQKEKKVEPEKKIDDKKKIEKLVLKELEDKITESLGTKVTISKRNKNKGSIVLEYYSQEDLERLTELLLSRNRGDK